MIKHLLKLVWNRKRVNFLITIEIFVSFLVLFLVTIFAVYYAYNYRQPLGFNYENVWNINIDIKQESDESHANNQIETMRQLHFALKDFSEIERAAGAQTVPYSQSYYTSSQEIEGKKINYEVDDVTDDFKEVMNLNLVAGRWFGKEDDSANFTPVVINRKMAEEAFGSEDPIGKTLFTDQKTAKETKVIGLVSDFRKSGEYAGLDNFLFRRKNLDGLKERPPRNILIKVYPGTTAELEERIIKKLQAIAKDWSFEVAPLAQTRESFLTMRLAPVIVLGIVAAFLMIMVALGLTGVLWQNVTQRMKEIGLRRAKGATAGKIYRQILGELFIITSFGLLFGLLVVVQFPLLDLIGFISAKIYFYSIIVSMLTVYLLTIFCGLYPGHLATKIQPAEALHYE